MIYRIRNAAQALVLAALLAALMMCGPLLDTFVWRP